MTDLYVTRPPKNVREMTGEELTAWAERVVEAVRQAIGWPGTDARAERSPI